MNDDTESAPVFPMAREDPLNLPSAFGEFYEREGLAPITLWNGDRAWLATRHADVKQVLRSSAFSSQPRSAGYPLLSKALASLLVEEKPPFTLMDEPEHNHFRRMLSPMFTISKIARWRPEVQKIVDDALDDFTKDGGPADFFENFALVIPSLVISDMMGVPYEDHEFFQDVARKRMDMTAGPEVPIEAGHKLAVYLTELIDRKDKAADPGDDVTGNLLVNQIRPGKLSVEDAVVMLRQLLQAGHETTAHAITMGLLAILLNRDQLEEMQRDSAVIPGAVEEMLRYGGVPHIQSSRAVAEDVVVGGQSLCPGEGVVASLNAASRDPSVFPDPDKFDIHRSPNRHMIFADGIHSCIGAPLARLEMIVAFETILRRLPDIDLAVPFEELNFLTDRRPYGVAPLPVRW